MSAKGRLLSTPARFIFFLCVLAAPFETTAQQDGLKIAKIGWLHPATPASAHLLEAFQQGLREVGHVEEKRSYWSAATPMKGRAAPGLGA